MSVEACPPAIKKNMLLPSRGNTINEMAIANLHQLDDKTLIVAHSMGCLTAISACKPKTLGCQWSSFTESQSGCCNRGGKKKEKSYY